MDVERHALVLKCIKSILKEEGFSSAKPDDDLVSTIGLDSLAFARIIVALEDEFNCTIPDSELFMSKLNTMNKISSAIVSVMNTHNT